AFGVNLSTDTLQASALPLPTVLGGTTVKVRDRAGIERLSPLFYVAPTQINYLIPSDTAIGTAIVTVTNANGVVTTGFALIANIAPGVFTADGSGRGLPAGGVFCIKTDGTQL